MPVYYFQDSGVRYIQTFSIDAPSSDEAKKLAKMVTAGDKGVRWICSRRVVNHTRYLGWSPKRKKALKGGEPWVR